MIEPSTRRALAAFLHDVGTLAGRAGNEHARRLDAHKMLVGNLPLESWSRDCIKSTTNAKALDHFRLHFKAMLGLLKALRG
jgi:hypothetical protein